MNLLKGFKEFKEKIVTASEDFSNSILSKQRGRNECAKDKILNDSVGAAELLKCYQDHWAAIHTDNFNISKAASQVDTSLERIYTDTLGRYDAFLRVHNEAAEVFRLNADLDHCLALVNELGTVCQDVDDALSELEDLVENKELRTRLHARNHELLVQRKQTQTALDQRRVHLAQAHAARVAEIEADKQREQLERQATFEEEFRRDVEFYREHQQLPESIRSGSFTEPPQAQEDRLANVVLEDVGEANEALDSFLEDEKEEVSVTASANIKQGEVAGSSQGL